jgi:hypothetical protein
MQLLKRIAADTPGLGDLLNRLRPAPPLPYKPLTIDWTLRELRPHGVVDVRCYAMASMWTHQHVRERGAGRPFWRAVDAIERRWPDAAARLGNYVVFRLRKFAGAHG